MNPDPATPGANCHTAPLPGILVADGDPAVRQMLRTALRSNGFAVWEAADGDQALHTLEKNRAKISAALIDLHLPQGGLTVLEALRQISPGLRCCLMTASVEGDGYTHEQVRAADVTIVFKPFKVSHLLAVLRHLTGPVKA